MGFVASCGSTEQGVSEADQVPGSSSSVRLLFVGDVMLGRDVGPLVAAEGPEFFEGIRYVVSSADLAMGNLESPLTTRPHVSDNPNALEADPAAATLLAGAGFDMMTVANNHAGDAGAGGLDDTVAALSSADIVALGVEDTQPTLTTVNGVKLAFLAFDLTGMGPDGVIRFSEGRARADTRSAAADADVAVVSLHGGIEYLSEPDPIVHEAATRLASWGADIVWSHGSHVVQPVTIDSGSVVAAGLGNFVFDQERAGTREGLILEVLVNADGPAAYRVGHGNHAAMRPLFDDWDLPSGPAVLLGTEWWNLVSYPPIAHSSAGSHDDFPWGDAVAADRGDATSSGDDVVVVSYRRPFRPNEANELFPEHDFEDARGRSAHLGVFEPDSFDPMWASGTMLAPVADLAVCSGSIALSFDRLDDPTITSTGAWVWWDFGFTAAEALPGGGSPGCADVDRDGRLDPVITGR